MQHLSNDDLRQRSAAIFARHPDNSRVSERYGFIPTVDMLKAMRDAGFVPMQAAGQRSYKNTGNDKFGRHMIRFAPLGQHGKVQQVGDVVPNVVLYNSHNGRTMYRLIAGLFRLVCSNGLTVAYRDFGSVEIKHSADALIKVVEASDRIIANARDCTTVLTQMRGIKLDEKEQVGYASRALKLRYGNEAPIKPSLLLEAKRTEDNGADLWRVYNRVQENLTRGGMQGQATTGRRMTVRPLTNIRRDIAVNLDLWGMTMDWMRQHGHQPKLAA